MKKKIMKILCFINMSSKARLDSSFDNLNELEQYIFNKTKEMYQIKKRRIL